MPIEPYSCSALPHCPGAVGSGAPTTYFLTAKGQWAVELLQRTVSTHGGVGQWNCYNALPYCLGAVGGGTPTMHSLTAWGKWAGQLL